MANEEVDRGVGRAVLSKAHAVALEHRAGARVGVHMPVPGGIHLGHIKPVKKLCTYNMPGSRKRTLWARL